MDEDEKNEEWSRGEIKVEGDLPMAVVECISLPPPKIDKDAMETNDADIVSFSSFPELSSRGLLYSRGRLSESLCFYGG